MPLQANSKATSHNRVTVRFSSFTRALHKLYLWHMHMPQRFRSKEGCKPQGKSERCSSSPAVTVDIRCAQRSQVATHPPASQELRTQIWPSVSIWFSTSCQTLVTFAGHKEHLRLLQGSFHLPHQAALNVFGNLACNLSVSQFLLLFSLPLLCLV